jgi:hypothetical protein
VITDTDGLTGSRRHPGEPSNIAGVCRYLPRFWVSNTAGQLGPWKAFSHAPHIRAAAMAATTRYPLPSRSPSTVPSVSPDPEKSEQAHQAGRCFGAEADRVALATRSAAGGSPNRITEIHRYLASSSATTLFGATIRNASSRIVLTSSQ